MQVKHENPLIDDEMLVTTAVAELRKNPAGGEFLEVHTMDSSIEQVKLRSKRMTRIARGYNNTYPVIGYKLVEIREVGEA